MLNTTSNENGECIVSLFLIDCSISMFKPREHVNETPFQHALKQIRFECQSVSKHISDYSPIKEFIFVVLYNTEHSASFKTSNGTEITAENVFVQENLNFTPALNQSSSDDLNTITDILFALEVLYICGDASGNPSTVDKYLEYRELIGHCDENSNKTVSFTHFSKLLWLSQKIFEEFPASGSIYRRLQIFTDKENPAILCGSTQEILFEYYLCLRNLREIIAHSVQKMNGLEVFFYPLETVVDEPLKQRIFWSSLLRSPSVALGICRVASEATQTGINDVHQLSKYDWFRHIERFENVPEPPSLEEVVYTSQFPRMRTYRHKEFFIDEIKMLGAVLGAVYVVQHDAADEHNSALSSRLFCGRTEDGSIKRRLATCRLEFSLIPDLKVIAPRLAIFSLPPASPKRETVREETCQRRSERLKNVLNKQTRKGGGMIVGQREISVVETSPPSQFKLPIADKEILLNIKERRQVMNSNYRYEGDENTKKLGEASLVLLAVLNRAEVVGVYNNYLIGTDNANVAIIDPNCTNQMEIAFFKSVYNTFLTEKLVGVAELLFNEKVPMRSTKMVLLVPINSESIDVPSSHDVISGCGFFLMTIPYKDDLRTPVSESDISIKGENIKKEYSDDNNEQSSITLNEFLKIVQIEKKSLSVIFEHLKK